MPVRAWIFSDISMTWPTPSATMMMKCFLPVAEVANIRSMISFSKSKGISGTMMLVAPQAMPTFSARYPARRPMTSTTLHRSCDWAVSRSLSIISMQVFRAVS